MSVSIVALGWWCPQIVLTATTVRLPTLRSQDFDTDHAVTIALRPERHGCGPPPEAATTLRLCFGLRQANRVYLPGWQPVVCAALGEFAPPRLRAPPPLMRPRHCLSDAAGVVAPDEADLGSALTERL